MSAYILATGIGSICARNTCISSICAIGIWIGCTNIGSAHTGCIYSMGTFARVVKLNTLVGSKVTLTSSGVNNLFFLLFMGLILVSIQRLSYCN